MIRIIYYALYGIVSVLDGLKWTGKKLANGALMAVAIVAKINYKFKRKEK